MKKNLCMMLLSASLIALMYAYLPFNLVAPALGSSTLGFILMSCMLLKKIYVTSLGSLVIIKVIKLFFLPTLCATLYWQYQMSMAVVALLCIPLFCLHPVGYSAGIYSLFWIIPMMSVLINRHSVIAKAFGSTFVAHALGSVLFMYATPHTSAYWISLIPWVILERMIAAGVMITLYYAQRSLANSFQLLYSSLKDTKIIVNYL